MTRDEFLTLATVKARCGISGTDLDGQLGTFLNTAISVVESRTRRHIIDASDVKVRSPDAGNGRDYLTFYIHDAKPITAATTVRYRTAQDNPGFDLDGSLSINERNWDVRGDCVRVYNGDENGVVTDWPARDKRVHFEATLDVGMASGTAPPEFEAAALMIVRELQEGSMLETLPHNIVDLVLQDHVKPSLTATDEILLDAGLEAG